MKKRTKILLLGALGYPALELLARGRTHPSMIAAGAASAAALCAIDKKMRFRPMWQKCAAGAAAITAIELHTGLFCNKNHAIWDYSRQPMNVRGQICPAYSVLWGALSLPVFLLLKRGRGI